MQGLARNDGANDWIQCQSSRLKGRLSSLNCKAQRNRVKGNCNSLQYGHLIDLLQQWDWRELMRIIIIIERLDC